MTHEVAVEYALSEEEPVPTVTPLPEGTQADVQAPALTHREEEVTILVAQGLTNRQISSGLGISEK